MRIGTIVWGMLALAAPALLAQSPRGEAAIELNGVRMSIDYGRPSLSGRDVLAQAPAGTVWRLGADAATTLTLDGSAVFGNIVLPAGEYSLFAERTGESAWTLIVNSQSGQWGTERDSRKDIAGVPLKWERTEDSVEQLTIELTRETEETGILSIRWGTNRLRQRFRLAEVS